MVEVRVYENACEPQVSFPQGALLGELRQIHPSSQKWSIEPEPSWRTGASCPTYPALRGTQNQLCESER